MHGVSFKTILVVALLVWDGLDGLGVHLTRGGRAGYHAGNNQDGDEGQSDKKIVHCGVLLAGGLLLLPS